MDTHERVDARDLEHAGDTGIGRCDEVELTARVARTLRRRDDEADTGRVEEGATREVDDEVARPALAVQGILEDGHRGEVQFAHDVDDDLPAGRLLHAYVKIAGRGHVGRV